MKKILLVLMAMFALGFQNVNAQDGIKIVTNHPDFKIKVKRCAASGKTVIIDFILTNEGANDVENMFGCGGGGHHGGANSEAYDDEGNIYKGGNLQVKVANSDHYSSYSSGNFNIPVGVPMKYSVKIDGVPQSAESIARLKMFFFHDGWGLGWDKPVRISNIPISRN